jgi:membrane-associated phospholipid phosphatase
MVPQQTPPDDQAQPRTFHFSDKLENHLRRVDDPGLRWCQRRVDSRLRYWLALALTAITTVEAGVLFTFVLCGAGFCRQACVWNMHLLVLSLVSQVPKRFIWRSRPHMQQRAVPLRRDRTSSFPSRGVTCAWVYPVALIRAFRCTKPATHMSRTQSFFLSCVFVGSATLLTLATAWARVFLGVHFPTDTIAGFLQGLLIIALVPRQYDAFCPQMRSIWVALRNTPKSLDGLRFVGMTAVGAQLLLIAELPRLQLWGKASFVFGAEWSMIALGVSGLRFRPFRLSWEVRLLGALISAVYGAATLFTAAFFISEQQRHQRSPKRHHQSQRWLAIPHLAIFLSVYGAGVLFFWIAPKVLSKFESFVG